MSIAILLMQMGGPRRLDEVEEYIRVLFSDPDLVRLPAPVSWFRRPLSRFVAKRRAPEVREQYRKIGGGSPNNRITTEQAQALESELRRRGYLEVHCFAAMTYTPPSTVEALREALALGCDQILALSMFPQFCGASTGASVSDLKRSCAAIGYPFEDILVVDRWSDDPGYLDALAARCQRTLAAAASAHPDPPHLVISAHGVPVSYVRRGDPYVDEIRATVDGLLARLESKPEHTLSFQSRATPVKWVEPATDATLQRLAGEGVRNVVMLPISFVNDHIETLFEIDLLLGDLAKEAGIESYRRVPSFNADRDLINVLADLVLSLPAFARPSHVSST